MPHRVDDPRLSTRLADVVTQHPGALPPLFDAGVDLCAQASVPLADAMGKRAARAFLTALDAQDTAGAVRWDVEPLEALLVHLLRVHATQRQQLADLAGAMGWKMHVTHPAWARMVETLSTLPDELELHMRKEEQVLFPLIASGQGRAAGVSARIIAQEHRDVAAHVRAIQKALVALATVNLPPAPHALVGLTRTFAVDLARHIHLEDHILLPRALAP